MATTALQLRRELLTDIRDNERQISKLLAVAVAAIGAAAVTHKNDKKRFERSVLVALALFWADYQLLSSTSNATVAQSFVSYVNATVATNLKKVGADKTLAVLEKETSGYAKKVGTSVLTRKSPYDAKSINQRIVTLQRGSKRVVQGLMNIGVNADLSVNQIARGIQNYIDPSSQAGKRFTAGNATNYKAVKIGKTLPKGSIRYNAVRIARSEMMTTYDMAGRNYYDNQPWSNGWDWFLSGTHAVSDQCDVLARSNPHKNLPPRPHPQCACDARPHIVSLKGFEQLVKSGKIH